MKIKNTNARGRVISKLQVKGRMRRLQFGNRPDSLEALDALVAEGVVVETKATTGARIYELAPDDVPNLVERVERHASRALDLLDRRDAKREPEEITLYRQGEPPVKFEGVSLAMADLPNGLLQMWRTKGGAFVVAERQAIADWPPEVVFVARSREDAVVEVGDLPEMTRSVFYDALGECERIA